MPWVQRKKDRGRDKSGEKKNICNPFQRILHGPGWGEERGWWVASAGAAHVINRLGIVSSSGGSPGSKLKGRKLPYAGQTRAFPRGHLRARHSHQPGLRSVGAVVGRPQFPLRGTGAWSWAQRPAGRLGLSGGLTKSCSPAVPAEPGPGRGEGGWQ